MLKYHHAAFRGIQNGLKSLDVLNSRDKVLIKSNLYDQKIIIFKEWYCTVYLKQETKTSHCRNNICNLFHQVSQLMTMYKSLIPSG